MMDFDSKETIEQRKNMVERQLILRGIKNQRVIEAFCVFLATCLFLLLTETYLTRILLFPLDTGKPFLNLTSWL